MASVTGSADNGSMVQVDEAKIRGHVDGVVRSSVDDLPPRKVPAFKLVLGLPLRKLRSAAT